MMQLELRSFKGKLGVAIGILLCAISYVTATAKQFLGSCYSQSQDPDRLRRAISLDRGNAEYQDHLGRYE